MPGTVALAVKVTHISQNEIWLLLEGEELLLPYEQFPWFHQATIGQVLQGEQDT